MMNKPTVLSTGAGLLPAAVWEHDPRLPELADERFSNVICSADGGETWTRRGGADVPRRVFDEHMVVERKDGSLWMLVRTDYGAGESISADRGFTWTPGRDSGIAGPNSRFFIRRLRSGRLLLVYHRGFTPADRMPLGRTHLAALAPSSRRRSGFWHSSMQTRARDSGQPAFEEIAVTPSTIISRSAGTSHTTTALPGAIAS